jgi:hypothetical protein
MSLHTLGAAVDGGPWEVELSTHFDLVTLGPTPPMASQICLLLCFPATFLASLPSFFSPSTLLRNNVFSRMEGSKNCFSGI